MSALILIESALFATTLCVLHRLRGHLGLVPLYLTIGVLEVFFFVAGKGLNIAVPFFGTEPAALSGVLFLPLLLGSTVLVYVLEGTLEARRLLIGLVIIYVLHGIIDLLLIYHAGHPPTGYPDTSATPTLQPETWIRAASLVALLVDTFVIVVLYQLTLNRFPSMPSFVPLFAGLVLVPALDGVLFSLIAFQTVPEVRWLQNLQTGFAAGLPIALYLDFQLRRHRDEVTGGILDRSAFDIITLRAELEHTREQFLRMQTIFRRYLSKKVIDTLDTDPDQLTLGGEKRVVTILFADIEGYSTLSESIAPDDLITVLNLYFARIGGVILEHDGMINEFEGDAILAVFNAPLDQPDHAARAIHCAAHMLEAVEALNQEWENTLLELWRSCGLTRLSIRIGVHTGEVVVGNVGLPSRMKYAVIGDTVNTAARIETLNKALSTHALISRTTVDAVPLAIRNTLPDLFNRGEHHVRGRTESVRVFAFQPGA